MGSRRSATVAGLAAPALALAAAGIAGGSTTAVAAAVPGYHAYVVAAVGVPLSVRFSASQAGAVDVYLDDGTHQVLDELRLGLVTQDEGPQSFFGASVAVTDLDGDGYSDLVVGSPGPPIGEDNTATGRIDLVYGTAIGLGTDRAVTLRSPGSAGDRFGSSVVVTNRNVDGGPRDLWVAAPGTTVGTAADAGAVYHYVIRSDGRFGAPEKITQDSPGIGGTAEPDDRFGEVLAPSVSGVLVGEPHEDIGTAKDAGAMQVLRLGPAGSATADTVADSQDWNQASRGVPGNPEAGDHFGASIAGITPWVGVPGEDLGSKKDAGLVQKFTLADPTVVTDLVPSAAIDQDSPGVPGVAEAGDGFGASLAIDVACFEEESVAIGSPGEDVGSVRDAGSVTVLDSGDDASTCPASVLRQGNGVPGKPETGDRLGAALGAAAADPLPADPENVAQNTVLIGVPGEDIGRTRLGRDVGRVYFRGTGYGFPGGDQDKHAYGSVISRSLQG